MAFAARIAFVGITLIGATGCAAMQPTPAQERGYTHAEECTRVTGHTINVFVDPQGRLRTGEARLDSLVAWKACMRDRFGYRWQGE
jgi:hypothetical protein